MSTNCAKCFLCEKIVNQFCVIIEEAAQERYRGDWTKQNNHNRHHSQQDENPTSHLQKAEEERKRAEGKAKRLQEERRRLEEEEDLLDVMHIQEQASVFLLSGHSCVIWQKMLKMQN